MIKAFFIFSIEHPTITGILIGAGFIGGPLAVIGWTLGYEHAMHKYTQWMRPKKVDQAYGDVPALPAASIERRPFPTTPGRRV